MGPLDTMGPLRVELSRVWPSPGEEAASREGGEQRSWEHCGRGGSGSALRSSSYILRVEPEVLGLRCAESAAPIFSRRCTSEGASRPSGLHCGEGGF